MGLAPHDTVQSQATTDGPQMTQNIGNLRDNQKPFRTMCVKLSLTGTYRDSHAANPHTSSSVAFKNQKDSHTSTDGCHVSPSNQ